MDWGAGRYERIAAQLLPAARTVVDAANPRSGERALDIGCGTGSASLLAAARGAETIGVDPAPRLLAIAAAAAEARGLPARFECGHAAALPLADASIDVSLSAFGVVFAPDAHAAAAEIDRVTARAGRVALSAWLPGGALAEVIALRRDALAESAGTPPGPVPYAWHDADALRELFAPLGFTVALEEHRLEFVAGSPEDFLAAELREHPMWIAARALLEPTGALEQLRTAALEILTRANEAPTAFAISSPYVVAVLSR